MKYNNDPDFVTDYEKLLKDESQKRKEFMKEIIKSRGVEFQESIVERKPEKKKTYDELLKEIKGIKPKT
jgi:methionine synthase II (cobalamin-independent)